jgi:cell division cycle protein 37
MLKEVILKMPEEDAKYHMKRCVDSGLWVADANAKEDGLVEVKEPIYEEAGVSKKDDLDLD